MGQRAGQEITGWELLGQDMAKQNAKKTAERVFNFICEDDKTFFQRTIQGLSPQEIEEFLIECPEYRDFYKEE